MFRNAGKSGCGDRVAKLMTAPLDLSLWEDWRLLAEARDMRTQGMGPKAVRVDNLPGVEGPNRGCVEGQGNLAETAARFEAEHARRCG